MSIFKILHYICPVKHNQVRHTIIETASQLFYANGYNRTGINEVIAESGVAKATLYNHFRSKDELCLAYLDHRNTHFMEAIRAFVVPLPAGKEQLLGVFGFLKSFYNADGFNGCWCINTIAEIPEDNVSIITEIQAQKKGLILFIEGLLNSGYPNQSEAQNENLARKIYILYEGAVAESNLHNAIWPVEAAEELCQLLLT